LKDLQETSGENVFLQVLWVSPANHHFYIHLISSSPQSSVKLFLSTPLRCRESNSTASLIINLNAEQRWVTNLLATLPMGKNPSTHWSLS